MHRAGRIFTSRATANTSEEAEHRYRQAPHGKGILNAGGDRPSPVRAVMRAIEESR